MICRFVSSIGGSTIFDLNDKVNYFYLEGSEFPLPEVKYDWVENALNDGARLASWTLGDNKLTLNLLIKGTTAAETYQKLQNFLRQVLKEGYLEVSLWGASNSVYYKTRPALPKLPDITKKYVIDQYCVSNIKIEIPVFPRCWTSKVRLDLCKGLGSNDSFALRDANDFTHWAEVVSGGTITANTTDFFTGGVSCKLTTTNVAHTTSLTDAVFIPVDATHHHNAKLYVYKNSGTLTLDHDVLCYDEDATLLDTLALLTGYNPAATTWLDAIKLAGFPVVNPVGGTAPAFPVGTTQAKRQIRHDTTVGVVSIDSLLFEDSEYIVDHEYESACGFQVPVGIALGDLKSEANVFITNPNSPGPWVAQNSGIASDLTAVAAYAADKVWAVGYGDVIRKYDGTAWGAQTNASLPLYAVSTPDGAKVWAVGYGGTIRYTADGGATAWGAQTYSFRELAVDPGFEDWASPTALNQWDKTLSGATLDWVTDKHGGTYAARITGAGSGYINPKVANLTPYVSGETFALSVWVKGSGLLLHFELAVGCFDSSGNYLGQWPSSDASGTAPAGYTQYVAYATGTPLPGTAYVGSGLYAEGHAAGDWVEFDDVSLKMTTPPVLYGVHAITTTNIVAVGEHGTIIGCDGTTWTEQVSGTTNTLHAIHADNTDVVRIAVGDNGTILTSADGITWVVRASGTTTHLYGVFSLDSTHAWAVGQYGTVLFSADAGVTWTLIASLTTTLYDVYASDATHIWAVGLSGTILFSNGATYVGAPWVTQSSGTLQNVFGVSGISTTSVWAVGNLGTILHALTTIAAIPLTNFAFAQRNDVYDTWSPVKDAVGAGQTTLYTRHGQAYRQMLANVTEKFRWPVGSHRGRYIISIGCSFGASTTYDKITLKYYLEDAEGNKISALPDITPTVLDMGDPNTKFKEVASQTTRLANLSIPTHFVPAGSNENNVYQCVEVDSDALLATPEWLDEITLIPVDHFIRLSGWSGNAMILDSDDKIVLLSQDGGLDTTAAFDPTKVEGACEFYADPNGMNFTMLASNIVSGDEELTPKVNVALEYYPAYLLTAE